MSPQLHNTRFTFLILDSHIGNSRDLSFEQMVKRETKNRGVDIVLNSLVDEKLIASVRCLAHGGNFLEIGKFDLANDKTFLLGLLEKEAAFHGIMLDAFFDTIPMDKFIVQKMVSEGIQKGFVKPLPRTLFQKSEVEKAFRYMMTGKHVGKVLITIREERDEDIIVPNMIPATPRYWYLKHIQ